MNAGAYRQNDINNIVIIFTMLTSIRYIDIHNTWSLILSGTVQGNGKTAHWWVQIEDRRAFAFLLTQTGEMIWMAITIMEIVRAVITATIPVSLGWVLIAKGESPLLRWLGYWAISLGVLHLLLRVLNVPVYIKWL